MSTNFFRELETERLWLKNISMEDREFIFKQFSNDEVNRYLFDEEPYTDISEADGLIAFYLEEEPRNQHRWIMIRKEDNAKVGTCGFHCWDREAKSCEIGYDLSPNYWKMGYAREALSAILAFAEDEMKLESIDANIYPENVASIKAVENFGFQRSDRQVICSFRDKDYIHDVYSARFI